ncbi:hypothetical protein J4464_06535 [Candidatus Woesearchaeota archaeon]|nr:hypothetical protein [Candidatus Woesearchaeota archaeon]
MKKQYTFGLGSVFSLIVVFFIYLYARDQTGAGWGILAFIAKWYVIIFGGLLALAVLLVILVTLVLLGFFIYARLRMRRPRKNVVDAEYRVDEE